MAKNFKQLREKMAPDARARSEAKAKAKLLRVSGVEYIAYLYKDPDEFGVSFPDFPGCVTAGKTIEEAHRMAAEVLEIHIAGMIEDGEAIPEPSTRDDLTEDEDADATFLVHVEPKPS